MAHVCVGCGLDVAAGKLVLGHEAVTGYVNISGTYILPNGFSAAELSAAAPDESNGNQDHNFGVMATELGVLTVDNPSDCRTMQLFIHAHGRTRLDTVNAFEGAALTANQEVRNEIRVSVSGAAAGDWYITDLSSYAQLDTGATTGTSSREWNYARPVPPVSVPPGETATFDRRGCFRWEQVILTHRALYNLPGISVIGF